jgi:flagellar biosynthetic protein FlhB
MSEQDSDLSEEATQHKLDEARKKGNVAKSSDFSTVAVMTALLGSMYASGWDGFKQAAKLQQTILMRAGHTTWGADDVATWIGQVLVDALHIVAPLFLALAVAAVIVNVFQTGPIFTAHPLSPDPERINPAAGFKRVFSMRTLFDSAKSILKLIILGSVTYFAISAALPGLLGVSALDPKGYGHLLITLCAGIIGKLVFTMLVLGILDLAYTRWEYAKRMRMSKREVKDEFKQREGDPRIRSRIRELRKEMLKRSKAMKKLPSADVLIVNPTRLAVALSYKKGAAGAPQLVAKGAGELARKMRQVASRHQIPVVQNRMLARTLFREVDYDGYVPEKLYPQIAKIMVWVYTMRTMRNGQHAKPMIVNGSAGLQGGAA